MRAKKTSAKRAGTEQKGPVLNVLKSLLEGGRSEEVVSLFEKLVARNSELEQRLAQLLSRGHKNEGVSTAQLKLFAEMLTAEATAAPEEITDANKKLRETSGIDRDAKESAAAKKRQPVLRRPIPSGLRRVDSELTVPAEERKCPVCGKDRKCIGHDVSEVIELIPAEVVVRVDRREKLACKACEGELVRAPVGDKVVSAGRLGTRLVATLLVDKYDDGLPLHRTKQRLERMGLPLPISTLADQVTWASDLLRPLWRLAVMEVLAAKVMHLDGTGLPVLDRDAPDETVAAYLYASTGKKRGQKPGELGPEDMLENRVGYTVADASSLFDQSFKRDDLIECGCHMHARRRFAYALDAGDARAALPLGAYKKLYEIEAKVRDLGDDERLRIRQAESKPVWDELCAWCDAYQRHEPPSSKLGEAIRYNRNHRIALGRFLEDGAIPIDNGIVERLHVRAALTRKNYLFAGSDAGGERAAIVYTILACCRLAEVNPVKYLADVLPRLARRVRLSDIGDLMPARWGAQSAADEPDPSQN